MVMIDFLKKAWTIVHGFNRFLEKSVDYSFWLIDFFEKALTIVLIHFLKKHAL